MPTGKGLSPQMMQVSTLPFNGVADLFVQDHLRPLIHARFSEDVVLTSQQWMTRVLWRRRPSIGYDPLHDLKHRKRDAVGTISQTGLLPPILQIFDTQLHLPTAIQVILHIPHVPWQSLVSGMSDSKPFSHRFCSLAFVEAMVVSRVLPV